MRIRRAPLLGLALACPLALAPVTAQAAAAPPAPAHSAPQLREAALPNPLPPLVPVQINGPDANRIKLLFVGDGYTKDQLGRFHQDVLKQWAAMTAMEPYRTYQKFFNVYELDLASPVSGVSGDPTESVVKDTPLNMHFWCHGIERLLCVDDARARQLAAAEPDVNVVFAIANSTMYGGAGGPVITVAGGNTLAAQITPHEAAHTLAQLGDEYGGYGPATDVSQPAPANVSNEDAAQMAADKTKWYRWLGATAPDGSKIGAYPGANYYDSGYYRPSQDSDMRTLGQPFNQPSAEALIESFYKDVSPIDGSTPSTDTYLARNAKVSITTPQLTGSDFLIYWAVNGKAITQGYNSRTLDLSKVPNLPGKGTAWTQLSCTVVDQTAAVRDEAFRSASMTKTYNWWIKP